MRPEAEAVGRQLWCDAMGLLDHFDVPFMHSALTSQERFLERIEWLGKERDRLQKELNARAARPPLELLLASLEEDRCEVLMLISDALLDEGRDEEAKGWGWLAQMRKWPLERNKAWNWQRRGNSHIHDSQVLPPSIFDCLGPYPAPSGWPTARAAFEAAAHAVLRSSGNPITPDATLSEFPGNPDD